MPLYPPLLIIIKIDNLTPWTLGHHVGGTSLGQLQTPMQEIGQVSAASTARHKRTDDGVEDSAEDPNGPADDQQ